MTASWGGFGILWNFSVTYVFIRPSRHTFRFIDENPYYTLCFFDKKYKKILNYCGSHSGRDVDKIRECGLEVLETDKGNLYFGQAKLVLECSKLYFSDFQPENFLDKKIDKNYPDMDYHRMYIGKIVNCLINENYHC